MTPYREAGRIEPSDGRSPTLPTFDVSGGRGRSAADGARGYDGSGRGGHGGPGGDAGKAAKGVSSGNIGIVLASSGAADHVRISGAVHLANGVQQPVDQIVSTTHDGSIQLVARGGRGGHGGRGGAGGDGARGSSGSDATRYSSGSNGGPGGDGGQGGNGSSGAPGGRGGEIAVHVGEDDTHLLMLVTHAVDGGPGGRAGQNGPGGSGGAGGSGGSSYSWTETESYTDSQGHSHTRHHHHSNSGGSDGRSGRSGPPGWAELEAGARGRDGRFSIQVATRSGAVETYASRFELELVRFTFDNDNADGVFEPDEHVTIARVVVRNIGGMPTPTRSPVIYLSANAWVRPDDKTLTLPRPLGPGESIELPGTLGFHISMHEPAGPSAALESSATIDLGAWIPAANRTFGAFGAGVPVEARSFRVTFPARLSALDGAFALAAGERSRLAFSIENVSRLALGAKSETSRALTYRLELRPSEIRSEDLAFVDDAGNAVDLAQGFTGAIDRLRPAATHTIAGAMEFGPTAKPYTAARLWVTLGLGRLQLPADLRRIQVQELVVRVAERYRPNPDAEVLLVVQNRTTRDEVDAWRAVAEAFGVQVATWDLSLEGHVDLAAPATGGPLATQFAGKTILLLDGLFDTAAGERRARGAVDPDQGLAFGAEGGSIAFVGTARHPSWSLLPAPEGPPSFERDTLDGAVEAIGALATSGYARFVVERSHIFFSPSEAELTKAAKRLAVELDRAFPRRRHVVVHHWIGEALDAGFVTRTRLGTIDVYRTLDIGGRATGSVAATDEELHDPSTVDARLAPMALAFYLPMTTRLELVRRTLARTAPKLLHVAEGAAPPSNDGATRPRLFGYLPTGDDVPTTTPSDWLRWSIAAELVAEVGVWAARPALPSVADDTRDDTLPGLDAVARLDLSGVEPIAPDSELGRFLIEVIALVRAVAWNHVTLFERLPPLLFLGRRPRLYFRARALASVVFDRAFPKGEGEARARRREAKRALAAAFVRLEDLERVVEAATPNVHGSRALPIAFLDWLASRGVVVDSEIAASTVLPQADYASFFARREKGDRKRARQRERHQREAARRAGA